jgi:predicted dehydrogenase
MGLSHCAILRAHDDVELVAACDPSAYLGEILTRHTGLKVHTDYRKMLEEEKLDAVVVATPSRLHAEMVDAALRRDLHVFCEKPFCLDAVKGAELARLAASRNLVTQVGYHYRFLKTFQRAKEIIEAGILGDIHHVRAETYGPVVLREGGGTWRATKDEGGGCLLDYACHAIDALVYLVGAPGRVSGTVLNRVFSRDVDDEVYSTLHFPGGVTGHLAANWSDESKRRMSLSISLWGRNGVMVVERQEIRLFIRNTANLPGDWKQGWQVIYTTDFDNDCFFYLRGEEYSDQLDNFIRSVKQRRVDTLSPFSEAVQTDSVVAMIRADAARNSGAQSEAETETARKSGSWFPAFGQKRV